MGRWTVVCYETMVRKVRYVVEADNVAEAKSKLSVGDTIQEDYISDVEVRNRDFWLSDVEPEIEV